MVANPPTESAAAAATAVVLVVADSENVAKRIESQLRNTGHPIRCAWVTDLEDLEDALRRGAPDLLLCAENLKDAPLKDVVEISKRLVPDLPVLLLTNKFTPEETVAAMAAGARDQVSHEDLRHMRHLELVLMREFATHQGFRQLRATMARLADFESRHKQLVAGTKDAVAHIQEGILSHVNPAFAQMLGYASPDELVGVPLMDIVAPDHQPKVKDHLKLMAKGKMEGKPLECHLQHKNGSPVGISAQLTRGTVDGEDFIEMLIRAEATIAQAVAAQVQDGGAPVSGRLAFFDAVTAAITGASGQKSARAAFMIEVDDFAGMEERLGFQDAEQAVVQLQDWVRSRLSPADQLFRFSTGELAGIVHRSNGAEIEQLGDFLVKEIAKQIFQTTGHEAHVSLSITAYPLAGSEQASNVITEITREARKTSAKGGKSFANLGPTAKSSQVEREEARKAAQVKKAIEENRLKLAYQSIASLEGDPRQHFDVLVRLVDENGKEMHAAEFIRAAEKFGLMRPIDRWVTARALRVQAKRESAQDASSLFIKISEDSLKDADGFLAWLQEQLKTRALKQEEIVFEFQEVILQNHIRKARTLCKALQDLGALIAIEHFGIGANSVQMIEHVPAQFLKFHHSFTNSFNDKETQKKMTTLMEIAKQKNIKTIVSHVEDANVMARLWQMGVNYIQGYHVQEPEVVLLSADVTKG
jgi:PAS domain S-box-containing protein